MKGIIALTLLTAVIGGLYARSGRAQDFTGARISFSKNQTVIDQEDRVLVWKGSNELDGGERAVLAAETSQRDQTDSLDTLSGDQEINQESDNQTQVMDGTQEAGETSEVTPEKVEKLVAYIHKAESSNGLNKNPYALHNVCKSKGKSNEYGYGGMQSMMCFDSHEQATRIVSDWIKRHLELYEGSEAKTLCRYNLGGNEVNCKYYQRYIGAI